MFSSDATGCRLVLPSTWNVSSSSPRLIADSFGASRKRSELPLHERQLLDGQFDAFSGDEHVCAPSTYAALPAASIFRHVSFGITAADHVLDIGAGDGLLGATAVLQFGAASATGIELSASRVADGCAALARLSGSIRAAPPSPEPLTAPERFIELRVGDARTASFGAEAPSRVVMYATCFPRDLSVALQVRLASELEVGARVLAAGARGWQAKLHAVHRGGGRAQQLINEEVALQTDRACCVHVYQSSHADGGSQACQQSDRPCLGDDMREWMWSVVEVDPMSHGDDGTDVTHVVR